MDDMQSFSSHHDSSRCKTISDLIASVAKEQEALARILEAEHEKIEKTTDLCGVDMDDLIDESLTNKRESFIAHIKENPASADDCVFLLSIMRYIERVGDHACKIAEKVTYMVTGFHTVIA